MNKDQLKQLMCGYLAEWSSLDASMDSCAEDLWQRLQPVIQNAERFEWLAANNACIIECTTERYAFRSTAPNAVRELWNEHDGWTVSTLSIHVDPFPTMAEAVDYAMKVHNASNVM